MRNVVGPMDVTPGAMNSVHPEDYKSTSTNSQSIGTIAYQLDLYVVFESGIQMLADNPFYYYREKECTDFIASVPVTWDETKVLAAGAGEYFAVARRKGGKWHIRAITNSTARDLKVRLDFLQNGKTYQITSFKDGVNAGVQAMDYKKTSAKVEKGETLQLHLVRDGGWAAVIE